ncbi:hypothetical protein COY65_00855 [Candidatus Jorgensenbacteria bacterium CG_4_10_14_0_8_um_filter_39_13]|uniref:Zn-dependent hydrolase of the beta-lactamase fold-like protein n=2 Tax=Candidatus Joergenseniibacteriota TaxID=1752739 RepID=A0A2M7RI68_9BACT|nr:MAG: hypothetical protein COV54_02250 [Candidatus Jorgensenbacteria bacterium CG11_big_fil_rev_8_21_14_0_20_38_23]PIV13351.1 MAG: hypothetical protein COS46_00725 [Candidatus Jorgensenbacteria bacterium CG03_land_8_20_14_0_80_38_39]PIW97787.1 MAG: hypothetical protein COZ81_00760 [Candidatus Jorgensenbacteria bacterium CG_4_8_14_3_um_filter_38_10]PIY96429.1 MAG: hypothetical protein COY65_00855 [Candidatus Jorgensenbacteria bacterium CG_4_10_14_0_8_um_filter_39_13]PJA95083.1 MAG: hypothetica
MVINWYGENYFKIQSGKLVVLIDPTNNRALRGADLIISTQPASLIYEHPAEKKQFWVEHQGEYEFSGIFIQGWRTDSQEGKEKTIYQLIWEDIKIAVFGYLTKETKEIKEVVVPEIKGSDIIIASPELNDLIKTLKPKIFIPSLVDSKSLPSKLSKILGNIKINPEEKLVIKKKDLDGIFNLTIKCLNY